MAFCNYIVLLLGMMAATARGSADLYAQATASETNVFLGQIFNVDVLVKTAEKPPAPDLANLDGFNTTAMDEGRPTSGTNTWHYRFAFRARHAGELTIPALRFGDLYTKPIAIHAVKPESTDRMRLEQTLSNSSVYVGEPVLLKTLWDSTYPFGSIKAVDFHFPILTDDRFQLLDPYEPEKEKGDQATGLPVQGTRVLATRKSYEADDIQHQTLSFANILIPKKNGLIELPSATLLCAAEEEKDLNNTKARRSAFQYPAYFDNTFFDQNAVGDQWKRIYTETKPLRLEVKPLPVEGRPALFNGMVGSYSIDVSAEPTEVRVGDPITLTVRITAEQFMENIFFDPLRYQPNLINHFEIPSDRSLPKREEKSKIYTQTIRPLSSDLSEIPPLLLAYFNPSEKAYKTVHSDPIPIRVQPAEAIGVFESTLYQKRLRSVEEGIRQNHENPDMIKSRRPKLFGWASPPQVLAVLFFPPFVLLLLSGVSIFDQRKHHIHRTAKVARAYSIFRKNTGQIARNPASKSVIYTELDRVLRVYLGDRLHLNPGALSYRDAEQRLLEAGADPESLESLNTLFNLCETYRFTACPDEPGDAKQIIHDAMQTVKSVEGKLK